MHISITGNLGSGKSTISAYLSEKYGFEIYSTGKVQRQIARQLGISTLEMNHLMGSDLKYDHMIDDAVASIANSRKGDNIIFDSRLAWNFAPESFKVFLMVDIDTAAERVFNSRRGSEEKYASLEDTKDKLKKRAETERDRYTEIYNIDYFDMKNYDLVIDSDGSSAKDIAEIIFENAKKYYSSGSYCRKTLISLQNLFPTKSVRGANRKLLDKYSSEYKSYDYYADTLIDVAEFKGNYFILDGHCRALASLIAGLIFIPVNVVAKDKGSMCDMGLPRYLSDVSLSYFQDFEGIGKFSYEKYPKWINA